MSDRGRGPDRRPRGPRWAEGEWEPRFPRGPRWAEGEWEPRFRVRGWVALWLPVIVSLVVQVPAAVFAGRGPGMGPGFGPGRWWGSVDGGLGAAIRDGGGADGGAGADGAGWFAARVTLAVVGPVALVFARRWPGPVAAVVSAAAGAYVLVVSGDAAPPYIAVAFALVGAVVRGAGLWAWASFGAAWVLTVTLGVISGVSWQPALVVAVTLGLVLLLVVGEGIRARRRRFDDLRRRAAERRQSAATAERVRIARELHDVLAHSLSQINVQAGVGLHLIDSRPDEAAAALASIKATSKSALDEVRSVLGILRADPDAAPDAADGAGSASDSREAAPLVPEPDLDRLESLVRSVRSQGLDVTLDDRLPDHRLPKALQLAVYRIVQEALTNVIRHAGATAASVTLDATSDAVTVQIDDDGRGLAGARNGAFDDGASSGPQEGRGLLGMRERAALLGGRLDLTAAPGGGTRVAARLPRGGEAASLPDDRPTGGIG